MMKRIIKLRQTQQHLWNTK